MPTKKKTTTTRHAAQLNWGQGEDNQRVTGIVVRYITKTPNDQGGETGTSHVVTKFDDLDVRGHAVPEFLAARGWDAQDWPTKPPYTKPLAVTVTRNEAILTHEHTDRCGLVEWCPELPNVSPASPEVDGQTAETGSALIVGTSTVDDTEGAGEDDEPVIGTLYEHLAQIQANLERAERRAEQLRRERLTLAMALVDEGESIAAVAKTLGVSKQYLHKQISRAQEAQVEATQGEPMF
jgi:hypothetical protein